MITEMETRKISTSTITPLIDLFKMCPMGMLDRNKDEVLDMIQEGLMTGYVIHPACDMAYIKDWIEDIDMQYNSTFYKCWGDVTNKDRFELLVDQLVHYMTTYGTDFEMGAGYVPNLNPEEPAWNTYKVIKPCTWYELFEKCLGMICSGVALKSDTVKYLVNYVIEYTRLQGIGIDVDAIKNREALTLICDTLNIYPKDGENLFRYIIYKVTGETMIVKNRNLRNRIKYAMTIEYLGALDKFKNILFNLNDDQLIALAGVFNRYKQLFLMFKWAEDAKINKIINKIGHLSKKHHRPMKRGFWETILINETYNPMEVSERAKSATNYKLIQVMQSIRERLLLAAGEGDHLYIIRNGKVFMKENNYNAVDSKYFNWEEIYEICKTQLVKNLSNKACTVKFSNKFNLACPTSEKNFIGDVPMGSSVKLDSEGVFGIYWRNDWGTRDFDLSYNDINGQRIGWNSNYYNNESNIVYSGDITNAPNGANELMKFKNGCPDGIVYVNKYSGEKDSKFKLFFGKENKKKPFTKENLHGSYYMVNPNNVILETMVTMNDVSQMMCGVIINGTVYFISLSCGYDRVALAMRKLNSGKTLDTESMTRMLRRKAVSMIDLKSILLEAGFTEVERGETPELDLTTLDRSTLIDLFDKE